ncbi:MAG TPA: hypothetical protein VLR26_09200 [Frankiaceae bacterium]|nr:hypothetical protein [Frankiaceae bacterium]
MRIAVLAETAPGERRVAAVPETVERLLNAGWEVRVESGAGLAAYFPDDVYTAAGATVVDDDLDDLLRDADVVLSVQPPPLGTLGAFREGGTVISMMAPSSYGDHIRACRDHGLTAFALELVPRTARAQAMDVLSAQALVAGYRATLAAVAVVAGARTAD